MPKLHRPPAASRLAFLWQSLLHLDDSYKALRPFYEKYGDIVWLRAPGASIYLISNPAYIKHVLVDNAANNYPKNFLSGRRGVVLGQGLSSSEGAHWRRHRRMIQPAFQRERVLASVPRIVDAIQRVLDGRWQGLARAGEPVLLFPEMSRIVLTVLSQLVYSEDPPDDICAAAFTFMHFSIRPRSLMEHLPLPPKLRGKYLRRLFPTLRPSSHRINDFSWEKVRQRMARGEQPDDMLGHFITAQDPQGEKFSDVEVRDEFVEFFYGGHVSASIGLSWMWYLLSQHDEVRQRVLDTVERGLGGRLPTLQDFPALQYVSQTFDETLRVHSPSPGAARPATQPDKLGEFDVPVGTLVLSSSDLMHRHPAYWTKPEVFDPDRFAPEQVQARAKYVYIPYGMGQRVCIGAQLASMIATLTSAMVAQRFRLELVPGRTVHPRTGGAHYPDNLWMKVLPATARAAPRALPEASIGLASAPS